METRRGAAAAATWRVRGDASRCRRGGDVETSAGTRRGDAVAATCQFGRDRHAPRYGALGPKDPRCLTQLGGCTVVGADGEALYSWVDRGLCDVPDFEDVLAAVGE